MRIIDVPWLVMPPSDARKLLTLLRSVHGAIGDDASVTILIGD